MYVCVYCIIWVWSPHVITVWLQTERRCLTSDCCPELWVLYALYHYEQWARAGIWLTKYRSSQMMGILSAIHQVWLGGKKKESSGFWQQQQAEKIPSACSLKYFNSAYDWCRIQMKLPIFSAKQILGSCDVLKGYADPEELLLCRQHNSTLDERAP